MRRIKRNHQREHPRNIVFVDTEAIGGSDEIGTCDRQLLFRLAVAQRVNHYGTQWTDDEFVPFDRADKFWSWLSEQCKPKTVLWLFAHNVWFDMTMLGIQYLMNSGRITLAKKHKVCKACAEGSCKRCRCWKGSISFDRGASFGTVLLDGKRLNIVDSGNYFRSSLSDIGRSLGIEKGDMPATNGSDDAWQEYCKRDVHILKTAVCSLICNWYVTDLGNWQLTAPSLAFSCYRHRFMRKGIVVHDNKAVQEHEKLSYFGGECTVFFKGKITQNPPDLYSGGGYFKGKTDAMYVGTVHHLDVNSLYPHVMREYQYPSMYLGSLDHPAIEDVLARLEDYCIVAWVEIDSRYSTYPFRCDGRTWHPCGHFPTFLCSGELMEAIKNDDVRSIYCAHLYQKDDLFSNWVDFWYETKKSVNRTRDPAKYEFAKLLLTSLGGKFAQRKRMWNVDSKSMPFRQWGRWPKYLESKDKWTIARALGKIVQVEESGGYADHALVAISAHITSYGRMHMKQMRDIALESEVLYQDTDSLFLTTDGMDRLSNAGMCDPIALGKFKYVSAILEGGIYGRQDYEENGNVKKAGLPRNARRVGPRSWEYDVIESPESMFSRMPDLGINVKFVRMSGSELCSGRLYRPDGRSVPRNAVAIMKQCGLVKEE